jgi:hypothetical protein
MNSASCNDAVEIAISQYTYRPPGALHDTPVNYGTTAVDDAMGMPAVNNAYMTSVTATIWVASSNTYASGSIGVWIFE